MQKIVADAFSANKALSKKMKKYLPRDRENTAEIYTPRPILPVENLSLVELSIRAARENLRSQNKNELEAAARDIISGPDKFSVEDHDLAEANLLRYAKSADEEEINSAIWMARVLAVSNDKKYLKTLTEINDQSLSSKVAKEAKKAYEALAK